jgi:hypothetical protein
MATEEESKYYSMEFVEEDGKLYVLFCNADGELVARKEIPKDATIEGFIRSNLLGDN